MEHKLLFILIYLRKAWTQEDHGIFFDMTQLEANKWIHLLLPRVHQALDELNELPSRETTPETFVNETDVERGTPIPEQFFQDSGFLGFNPADITVVQPKKKPKGSELTAAEKERNKDISSNRIRFERVIRRVKRYGIVKDKLCNWK